MPHHRPLTILTLLLLLLGGCTMPSHVLSYPAIPDLATSTDLSATANHQPLWIENYTPNIDLATLPPWFTSEPHTAKPQHVNIANFACDGPTHITLTAKEPIQSFAIHPSSRNIHAKKNANTLTFTLPGPENLYIEINNLPPLCLFANPIAPPPVHDSDPNVTYFAPGVHRPGPITLNDNSTLYLAPGALVYGTIHGSPKNARILGEGILDGQYAGRLVRLQDASNIEVNGPLLRNGRNWQNTLTNCSHVTYKNVKVLSFGNSGDGIDPVGSRDITIDHCFFRTTDDCVAIKSLKPGQNVDNIQILNSTMVGFAFADGITIGFETTGPTLQNIRAQNCDIVLSRGGNAVGRHSAFSIIADGPGLVSNVTFDNIRVERSVDRLFELHITDGSAYVKSTPGHIQNILLKNIAWAAPKPILLLGLNPNHLLQNITFDHCTIAAKPLTHPDPALLTTNEFVKNVTFK